MRGFVFTEDTEIALRFLVSGAFDALAARHELTFVIVTSGADSAPGLREFVRAKGLRAEWVPAYPQRARRWQELFNISCIRYRAVSPSFETRAAAYQRDFPLAYARLSRLARPGRQERHRRAVERRMGLHPEMLALTLRERPDFFVLPSALLDGATDEVLLLSQHLDVPTAMLVAGWDNLSSKGLLFHQPARMGVWGEQARQHAIAVQRTPAERVTVLGAPHYEAFKNPLPEDRAALRAGWGVPVDAQVVLFAGTFRMFDETEVLVEMDRAIAEGRLPPMHVIYRPHPWRVSREHEDDFFQHPWKHVTMDPEMAEAYRVNRKRVGWKLPPNFLDRMTHLRRLYHASDAVMSPMSTVLLEALIVGLPTMALAFGDGKHAWSIDKVARMMHFDELYEIPGLIVCRQRDTLFAEIARLVGSIGDAALGESLRRSTRFFVHQDERTYGERVVALVDGMTKAQKTSPRYGGPAPRPGRRFRVEHYVRRSLVVRGLEQAVRLLERRLFSS